MLVSFPRDLIVEIPGHGRNLLNSAFAFGGPGARDPDARSRTSRRLQINHYLEVDFRGFKKIVDAIGHINIWFPTPVHDPYTGLDVNQAGCVELNGDQALAYARSRHYYIPKNLQNPAPWTWNYDERRRGRQRLGRDRRADLDRIPRQQYFLRTVSQAAIDKTGSNPLAIKRVARRRVREPRARPEPEVDELNALALDVPRSQPGQGRDVDAADVARPRQTANRVIAKFPDAVVVIAQLANFTPSRRRPS